MNPKITENSVVLPERKVFNNDQLSPNPLGCVWIVNIQWDAHDIDSNAAL